MKINLTKEAICVMAIFAVMTAGAVMFLYVPQGRKLTQVRAQIASQKNSLEADAQKAAVVPQMIRQVETMKTRFDDRWDKKLPRQKELGGFLKEIGQNLADESLTGQLIEPGNPTNGELYHTLPITMRFDGGFAALANFLDRLDQMERLTRIQKINVFADQKTSPAKLSVELLMNIYFSDVQG